MPLRTTMVRSATNALARSRRAASTLTSSVRAGYSPSALLIAAVLIGGALFLGTSVVASYQGVDVVSSLSFIPQDDHCPDGDPNTSGVGTHCFSDYYQVVEFVHSENPWSDHKSNYSASGMLPNVITSWIGDVAGSPRAGLMSFLLLLTAALVTPAVWASRGKSLTPRLVALGAFGLLTVPALSALDRGNSAALAVPALLAFLVAIRRGKFAGAVVAITAASLIRPQFLILIAVLWALRKWRLSVVALLSVGLTNLFAYAAWPRAFPQTLVDSVIAVVHYGRQYSMAADYPPNVSLGKGVYELDRLLLGFGGEPLGGLGIAHYGGIAAFIVATIVILLVIALGRELPVLLSASLVLMSATLFPGATWSYSLSSCLAIAAVLLRDPLDASPDRDRWRGALDGVAKTRMQAAAIGLFVLATAASLTRILLPHILTLDPTQYPGGQVIASTTASLAPMLWILASAVVIVAWGRGHLTETIPLGNLDANAYGEPATEVQAATHAP
ncbi:DUF2029 domain-containing protein [Demequina lutea]|uniref:DUF2029 domain-containing protein n=1 Tax=Demequina lutea TaxID=431489 RepID=A0A7Z0CL69_9MICO|nr:DUF2029 domain-containing protein [Demequina lutea]NYI42450.1 hypothetical protein [Demequina lutea]